MKDQVKVGVGVSESIDRVKLESVIGDMLCSVRLCADMISDEYLTGYVDALTVLGEQIAKGAAS
jgi:hypothetical protein